MIFLQSKAGLGIMSIDRILKNIRISCNASAAVGVACERCHDLMITIARYSMNLKLNVGINLFSQLQKRSNNSINLRIDTPPTLISLKRKRSNVE